MNREELDTLWFQAMRQSIEEGEDFIRYHFAALVAAAEREACAKVCEKQIKSYMSKQYTTDPLGGFREGRGVRYEPRRHPPHGAGSGI